MTGAILAFVIGINVLVFSVVNALWLRPLPVENPERVVTVLRSLSTVVSLDDPRLKIFDVPLAGQVVTTGFKEAFKPRISLGPAQENVEAVAVTPLYFSVLGIQVRGRGFTEADEQAGAEPVAVLSDRVWSRLFDKRADVIGTLVSATPRSLRIVGVAPPGFEGARRGERADLWVPTRVARDIAPADRLGDVPSLMLFARLRPDQNVSTLQQRYRELWTQPDGSQVPTESAPTITPLTKVYGTADSPSILIHEAGTLAVVSALSLLVLLGGSATIATLILTHYERRRQELAVRAALGATPARLARELAVELLIVGMVGGSGALLCGMLGARIAPALNLPGGVNIGRLDLSIDWRWWLMESMATLGTLALAGGVPLWAATHGRLAGHVTGISTTSRRALHVRQRLLALQVCATSVVLVASGLLIRTVDHSFRTAPGFSLNHTVFVRVQEKAFSMLDPAEAALDRKALALARRQQLMEVLASLPSVRSVAGGVSPIGPEAVATTPQPRTIVSANRQDKLLLGVLAGTPNLLQTLRVRLVSGRALTPSDEQPSPTPVVITASLANRLWPSGRALGEVFGIPELRGGKYLVVGVSDDFAFGSLSRPVAGVVITARGDPDFAESNLVLEAEDAKKVAELVPKILPNRVVSAQTGRATVEGDIAEQLLGAWAFSGFGLISLIIGTGGVFGLVAYLVQSRRRDLGIRLALGASWLHIVVNAVKAALLPVLIGATAGLTVGAMGARLFESLLVGLSSIDLSTYAGVAIILIAPALLAAFVAVWRLRSLSPAEALRN